jgi:hypothetical protein
VLFDPLVVVARGDSKGLTFALRPGLGSVAGSSTLTAEFEVDLEESLRLSLVNDGGGVLKTVMTMSLVSAIFQDRY